MARSSERSTTPIDKLVGSRVRERRVEIKMSQEKLAELIGVSFQQLQKYEAGANRIGASRLYSISRALEKPIGYFFGESELYRDIVSSTEKCSPLSDVLSDATTFEIVETFSKIDDHHLRRQLVEMLEAFCETARRDLNRKSKRSGISTEG